jgi:hypothetical protein
MYNMSHEKKLFENINKIKLKFYVKWNCFRSLRNKIKFTSVYERLLKPVAMETGFTISRRDMWIVTKKGTERQHPFALIS